MTKPPANESPQAEALREQAVLFGRLVGDEGPQDAVYEARNRHLLSAALAYARAVERSERRPEARSGV